MILDPRLVPWNDVVPGVGVAIVIAAIAFFIWRWRLPALFLLAAGPVVGWAVTVWNLQGSLPPMPPADATNWTFYFAVAAAVLALPVVILSQYRWWIHAATLLSILFVAAIWMTLLRPVTVPDESGTSLQGPVLFVAWIGCLAAMDVRKHLVGLSAEYAPWLVGLMAASVCLALTGTASISTLALALCLCALPFAIVVLMRHRGPGSSPMNFGPLTGRGGVVSGPEDDGGMRAVPSPPQVQAITLPLALTLPLFALSGAVYAYTPWVVSLLVVLTPVCGLTALRFYTWYWSRRPARRYDDRPAQWKRELIAIAVAIVAAAVPAMIAAAMVITAAAAEEPYY